MEAFASASVQDAQKRLNELLDLRRLCALVHPILREGSGDGKSPRRRKKPVPTENFVVKLFEGGGVSLPTDDAIKCVTGINKELAPIVREALVGMLRDMPGLTKVGGVDAARSLADQLVLIVNANSFRLKVAEVGEGKSRVMADNTARSEVRFLGARAKERADQFCLDVNAVLHRYFAATDKRMAVELQRVIEEF